MGCNCNHNGKLSHICKLKISFKFLIGRSKQYLFNAIKKLLDILSKFYIPSLNHINFLQHYISLLVNFGMDMTLEFQWIHRSTNTSQFSDDVRSYGCMGY